MCIVSKILDANSLPMSSKSTFYMFVAAVAATVASALVYLAAKARLAAFIAIGEGTPEEMRSAALPANISFLILILTIIVTGILFFRLVTQRRKDARQVSA